VIKEAWPTVPTPNESVLKSGEYLFDAAHSFRVRHKNFCAGGGKKKGGKAAPVTKPTQGTIWVAKEYPPWQATILAHLSKEYVNGNVPENKKLASDFAKLPELKKYQKKIMPFVQMVKERIGVIGVERGLQQTSEFDEIEVLNSNLAYLKSSLEVCEALFSTFPTSEIYLRPKPSLIFVFLFHSWSTFLFDQRMSQTRKP